jgi:hypothetical protein
MATQDPKHPQDPNREARIQRLLRQVEQQLREELPDPSQSLEQIEQQVVEMGRKLREQIERETLKDAGSGYQGPQCRCTCGQSARFVLFQPRHVVTLNGCRRLKRAYYHCRACRQGFAPLDQQLQLGRGERSVGVRALAARISTYLPFEKAAGELALLNGVALSPRTVEREAQAVGAALAAQWQEQQDRLWAGEAPAPTARPAQLHITMDGVMVHVDQEWKEAKIGCVYRRRAGEAGVEEAHYCASLAASVAFGQQLATLAYEQGVDYCREVALLGDGAEWIWQEGAKHFPRAVEILDFRHAGEHLWEFARAVFPEPAAQEAWIARQEERLLADAVGRVILEIDGWETPHAEAAEVQRKVGNYLRRNAHRMQYGSDRKQGYHIGTGVAEASCKSVVQARLKGTGMRWSKAGAEAMLSLRAAWCSTGPTDFVAAARRATLLS